MKREDPRGGVYYWIGGAQPDHYEREPGSDFEAIGNKKVSISPLHRDLTAYDVSATVARIHFGVFITTCTYCWRNRVCGYRKMSNQYSPSVRMALL